MKRIIFILSCICMLGLVSGCGDKSEIKQELERVEITKELPEVKVINCTRLSQADDYVYEQQIAACELYLEAHEITRTSDYTERYKKKVKSNKVGYYCNQRRKELYTDISEQLYDNIYVMVMDVSDCDNIAAYLKRVNYDTVNFYDYYGEYVNAKNDSEKIDAACNILSAFYEKNNMLALNFMDRNRDEITAAAAERIKSNSAQTTSLNMYISINNELIKALNTVYGGVPAEYADTITYSHIQLARRMLEEDNDLSEDDIDNLMYQLGEPTPAPTPEPTPVPTPTPAPTPEPTPTPVPSVKPDDDPRTEPTKRPEPQRTPQIPEPDNDTYTAQPEPTQKVYVFEAG